MLRHRLAPVALAAQRLRDRLAGPPAGFRILLFHDIPEDQRAVFAAFVDGLARDHLLLDPAAAAAWLAGRPPPDLDPGRRPCLLSFDDGFVSNLAVARDILAPRGIRALFFVNAGLVDLSGANQRAAIAANIFDGRVKAADLDPGLRLMTWEDLAALRADGHVVGAHGMTHRRLSLLAGGDLEREIAGAGQTLAERLGAPPDWYAYAFGDIGSISGEALAVIARHYRFCRSGVRGLNDAQTPPHRLHGDHVELAAPPAWRALVVEGGLDRRYRAARDRLAGL